VKQCSAVTLFEDVFGSKVRAKEKHGRKPTNLDLINYVDKFLKENRLTKSTKQFYKWKPECIQAAGRKLVDKKMGKRDEEKLRLFRMNNDMYEPL
jgi:hypothetical protein